MKHKVGQLIAYDNDSDSSNSLYGSLNFQVINMSSKFGYAGLEFRLCAFYSVFLMILLDS